MNEKENMDNLLTDKFLSSRETAKLLGIALGTLHVWSSNKRYELPFTKIGSLRKYRLSDINKFIENGNSKKNGKK